MVPGVVLAAGKSTRMGRSKALLPIDPHGGTTFLDRILRNMREGGVDDLIVVGRPEDDELSDAALRAGVPVRFVANAAHERGQLTSIVAAVDAVDHPGVRGLLVTPVDMPLVRPDTYAVLLAAFATRRSSIVRAAHGGRHGHPVIFARAFFDALRHADASVGAKAVLRGHADRVVDLEVQDPGVLSDVDTVADYIALFGRAPEPPPSTVPS